jgi:hypothetical protein
MAQEHSLQQDQPTRRRQGEGTTDPNPPPSPRGRTAKQFEREYLAWADGPKKQPGKRRPRTIIVTGHPDEQTELWLARLNGLARSVQFEAIRLNKNNYNETLCYLTLDQMREALTSLCKAPEFDGLPYDTGRSVVLNFMRVQCRQRQLIRRPRNNVSMYFKKADFLRGYHENAHGEREPYNRPWLRFGKHDIRISGSTSLMAFLRHAARNLKVKSVRVFWPEADGTRMIALSVGRGGHSLPEDNAPAMDREDVLDQVCAIFARTNAKLLPTKTLLAELAECGLPLTARQFAGYLKAFGVATPERSPGRHDRRRGYLAVELFAAWNRVNPYVP